MSLTGITNLDPDEIAEPRPMRQPPDSVSQAVGSAVFVRSHRFAELYIEGSMGRSPRLPVSRFYWDLEPQVVVDFKREVKRGPAEVAVKRAYCEKHGIRYLLVSDEFDAEGITEALAPTTPTTEAVEAQKPRTAPRRRRRA